MIRARMWAGWLLVLILPAGAYAQGVMLSGIGPVNASMGGASTAAPIEALSALAWNPAAISGLPTSELSVGLGLMLADTTIDSSIFGLSAGSTGSEPGVVPLPSIGWVHHANERVTFGLSVAAVAGFKTNYPASLTNPVLAPPLAGGLGSLYTEGQFLQIAPVISYAVTDKLSVGVGPTVTLGQITVDPLILTAPNDADGNNIATYPSGRGTRYGWGGGAQLGVYYITDHHWHLGASIKSPQWMEDYRVHTENELGLPYVAKFKFDLPMILSVGTAYSGFERSIFSVDLRYFDYKNTAGFGDSGFAPTGELRGLSWTNQFALATGMQYRVCDSFLVRLGYTFNTSPFSNRDTFYNVGSPLNYQHQLGMGASWDLSDCVSLHLAYTQYFHYGSTGPILTPAGAIPGSAVANSVSAYIGSLGVTVRY